MPVFFYNTNGTWSQDSKFNKGEYALNDLPDLNSFDGVVFDCTNTTNLDEIQYMVRKLQSVNVPVVSIGYKVDGFYYVGNDNKRLFSQDNGSYVLCAWLQKLCVCRWSAVSL